MGEGAAEVAALHEKVSGLEALLANNRDRVSDPQAHALDLRDELDATYKQGSVLMTLIETVVRALPPSSSEPRRSWRDWFGLGRS